MIDCREEWVLVPKKPTLEMSRAVREETRFCDPIGIYQKILAAAPTHPAAVHCDNCGCDWLDNGLNPVGCPYCKQTASVERVNIEHLLAENERLREALDRLEAVVEHFDPYIRDNECRPMENARSTIAALRKWLGEKV